MKGSIVAIVTPMLENGEVDFDSFKKLLSFHEKNNTDGIVLVGTTGESATLNVNEHIDVIEFTANYVDKRVPVIAGTGANSTQEAIDLSEESRRKGADYVLLVTPYYNKPNQRGLIAHFEKIADSVSINQILYNVPPRTACDLLPESVKVLSKHKNIIGIKEAVDCMDRIKSLTNISRNNSDFLVFSGDDPTFMDALNLGANGEISVAANVIPKSISNICSYIRENNKEEAKILNEINNNLYKLLFVESNPIPVKWMLYKMGLIENSIRLPLVEFDETFHEQTMSELMRLKLL